MSRLIYTFKIIVVLVLFLFPNSLFSQEHYFGIRGGYGISSIGFNPDQGDNESVSGMDLGVVYKLYAEKLMGTQIELNWVQKGYKLVDTIYTGKAIELPLMAQVSLRFGGFKVFANGGIFGTYMISQDVEKPDESGVMHTTSYSFTDRDNRFEYGLLGGGGLAFQLKKFEIQLEARYQYSLGYMMKPRYKQGQTIFSHRSHLTFSVSLFYNL
jgi:hypothetical protein